MAEICHYDREMVRAKSIPSAEMTGSQKDYDYEEDCHEPESSIEKALTTGFENNIALCGP